MADKTVYQRTYEAMRRRGVRPEKARAMARRAQNRRNASKGSPSKSKRRGT